MTEFTPHFRFGIPDFTQEPWHEDWENLVHAIDTAIYQAIVADSVVFWANETAYLVGQLVIDNLDGIMYVCGVSHTSPALPTTFAQDRAANPSRWNATATIPQQRGVWATATTYVPGDFVVDSNRYAVCVEGHVSGVFNTDLADGKWSVLIDLSTLASIGINSSPAGAIASAATTDIGSISSSRILVSGTTTITSYGTVANQFKFLIFSGALTVTHNATTLILPGAANRTTDVGGVQLVTSDSSGNWRELFWHAGSGPTPTPDATETVKGVVELATTAEAQLGTDTTRAIVATGLAAAVADGVALSLATIRDGVSSSLDTLAEIAAAMNLLAPLASPTFTGTVTVPTPSLNDDSTKAASTAYVIDEIADKTQAADGASLVLIHSITAASDSTIQFNATNAASAFNGTYDQLEICLSAVKVSADDSRMFFRIGTGAGPTIQSGATDYEWNFRGTHGTTTTDLEDVDDAQVFLTDNIGAVTLAIGNAAGEHLSGVVKSINATDSSDFHLFKYETVYTAANNELYTITGGAMYRTATPITAIEFSTPGSNFPSGRFALYGRRKS